MAYAIVTIVQGNTKKDLKEAKDFIVEHDEFFEGISYVFKVED
jgi:hypothetical protein